MLGKFVACYLMTVEFGSNTRGCVGLMCCTMCAEKYDDRHLEDLNIDVDLHRFEYFDPEMTQ